MPTYSLYKVPALASSIVCVDRSALPRYSSWVVKVTHPELDIIGPKQFDVAKLETWLHPAQGIGPVTGQVIYESLTLCTGLQDCLGIPELEAISKKGIRFFRQRFPGKAVFGWRSVALCQGAIVCVPFLVESVNLVDLRWRRLDRKWGVNDIALRFPRAGCAVTA